MAQPITWRNIRGSSGAGAGRLFRGAQDSLDQGFNALNKVLDRRRQTQDANWDTRKDNNTQAFLDQLARFRSPEELEAARSGGALMDQLQGYGAQIDRSAARTALDGRQGVLQERQTATQQFQDDQTQRGNRGLRGQLTDLIYDGNTDEAQRLFDANADRFVDAAGTRREMFGDRTNLTGEQRAVRSDARSERADARAAGRYGRQQTLWGREDAERENAQAADALMDDAYSTVRAGLPEGTSLTQYRRNLTDALTQYMTPSEAVARAGSLDKALTADAALAGLDQDAVDRGQAELDRAFNSGSNEFLQERPEDPTAAANEVLGEFADGDGHIFGISNPDKREDLSRQAGSALRSSVTVDGEEINITPALLRGAMHAVSDDWFEMNKDISTAVKDYVENSPDVMQRYREAQEYREASRQLNQGAAGATAGSYRPNWRDWYGD